VETDNLRRRLAAIMSADVKGYSRLMRQDEAATVQTLKSYREIMETLITQHHGRVVDSPGDNVLSEFASVVDAVQSAVAIQKELKLRNAALNEERRMEFRIGINLGDVIADRDRIYGDGVNIAARLEGLAEAGGICISRTAYDQIEDKLPFGYEYLGEKQVKNLSRPVHAYKVLVEAEDSKQFAKGPGKEGKSEPPEQQDRPQAEPVESRTYRDWDGFKRHLRTYVGVIGFLFIIDLLTGKGWWFYWPALAWGLGLFLHWSHSHYHYRPHRHRPHRPLIFERPARREEGGLKYLRVQVEPKGGGGGRRGTVNIRVPLKLLRAGVKLGTVLPGHSKEKINAALRDKGLDFDISSLEGEKLEEFLSALSDMEIDVDEKDKTVHIFCE
jgi:class 3 adenylate cyclase